MQIRHWLIIALTVFINLLIGAFGAFTLLIALNGFPESTGGSILLAYGLLFVVLLIGAGVAQWAALKFVSARPQWPLWLAELGLVVAMPIAVGVALAAGVLVIMLAFGAG
jgi:hypothetical protein